HVRLQAQGSEHDDLVTALALAVHAAGKGALGTATVRLLTSGRSREGAIHHKDTPTCFSTTLPAGRDT
ncbi:MAG: hypothetical protein RMK92_11970, partial [Armatimonadota bacterium]|nr:hypothetical protein [Armatimonadota bacterium]